MTAPPLAVLVVDDSDVLRTVVWHYLDDESDLQVIASVGSAGEFVGKESPFREVADVLRLR